MSRTLSAPKRRPSETSSDRTEVLHSVAGVVPPAAPQTLARRIYNDLIGVPPTPEQVQSFATAVSVNRQSAVESLVDQLLSSPMVGQRWARHWLDVARFSDGRGGFLEGDKALDEAWRYRDWVVDAFNRDLPINEFIRLQIAGDLSGEPSQGIATGFFAIGPTYQSDGGDPDSIAQSRAETLDDRIDDELNKKIKSGTKEKRKKEDRDLTAEEQSQLDQWKAELAELKKKAPSLSKK